MNGLAPGDDAQGLLYSGCSAHALAVVSANEEENGWVVRHINILAAPLLRRGQHGAAAASTRYTSRAAMVANLARMVVEKMMVPSGGVVGRWPPLGQEISVFEGGPLLSMLRKTTHS